MERRLNRNDLKVDCTALNQVSDNTAKNHKIVLYNINIPKLIVENDDEFRAALERSRDLIQRDFLGESVSFYISATYFLINNHTGLRRLWTGSFLAENNRAAIVSDFQDFSPDTFVERAFNNCQDVEDKLTWNDVDTAWSFDALHSIIVNFQCRVEKGHNIVKKYQLSGRTIKTFALP